MSLSRHGRFFAAASLILVATACGDAKTEAKAERSFPVFQGPIEDGSIEGVWKGYFPLAGMDHEIVSTITRDGAEWRVVYDNRDMGEHGVVAQDVRFAGETLTFAIPGRGARFEGTLAGDGRHIDGEVTMLGREIPLDLVLVAPADSES